VQSSLSYSLTQLEYAIAVHRLGSFSQAAKFCHVTQPTLSMQIQKLEESLGIILFDRSKKPILVTTEGEIILKQMQTAVFEARKLTDIVSQQASREPRGEIVVGVIPTVAPYLLPLLVPIMATTFPLVKLILREMQTSVMIQALREDEIDAGILAGPLDLPGIFETMLYTEPFFVHCQESHGLAKSKFVDHRNLSAQDIWLLQEGHCLRSQVLDICSIGAASDQPRQFEFESGSIETLKRLVATSGGYTLVPYLARDGVAPGTVLVPFPSPVPAREVGIAFAREFYKRNLRGVIESAIRSAVPRSLTTGKGVEIVAVRLTD
jgi:LysR family hydrogen peroxide-inducible transcriptional activator